MEEIKEYLDNFFKGTKNPSLDAMKYFMSEYNNFQEEMKFIHIAGTNGKGSCVQMISNILLKQGYKVGKFLSPHLIKYNERISINGKEITDKEMWDLICELKPKIEKYNKENKANVTLFELKTTMALLYFYRNNVDFVVLETGLGGLYDCTNIISKPLVSVISSIGYDHINILGNTLPDIAYQKAGIIKKNSNTVFFEQEKEVNQVFIDKCEEINNHLYLIKNNAIKNYKYDDKYQYFDYENYKGLELILKGKSQVRNAILCIECMKILNELGDEVSEKNIRDGLKTVIHKGRMEVLSQNPFIIFDGAHNVPAIENMQSMIDMYYNNSKKIYVVSILKRKDYKKMIQLLMKDKDGEFIFTSGNDPNMYVSGEELYNLALLYRENQILHKKELNEAVKYIMQNGTDKISFVIGSFYVYGDFVKAINECR